MATYTVTTVMIRPNTSTKWPSVVNGDSKSLWSGTKNSETSSFSADNLTKTLVVVWASKDQYLQNTGNDRSDDLKAKLSQFGRYMKAKNISCRITQEDGTELFIKDF
tara:strand:- start:891 stop:1211 length:321 start_codon:yes stop_codon:yes gene_type:complete